MRTVVPACILAFLIPLTGCGDRRSKRKAKTWQNDFSLFLGRLQQMVEASRTGTEGEISVDDLNREFLNKKVRWTGTLKYFHKGRPYFVESFVRINDDTKLSAVMYYPDPERVSEWEGLPRGTQVEYEGTISAVRVETVPEHRGHTESHRPRSAREDHVSNGFPPWRDRGGLA